MSIVAEQPKEIAPKSVLRHRPIGTGKETIPITTPRTSRLKHKQEPRTTSEPPSTESEVTKQQKYQYHWLVPVGLTMVSTIVLILLFQVAWAYGVTTYNDLRFGRPRLFQLDQVVGHHDSAAHPTHFIALNLHGQIQILELPGGDASHAKIIIGPALSGDGADLVPVTLQFVDRQGNHHPDMLVQCGGIEVCFKNQNGSFVPQ